MHFRSRRPRERLVLPGELEGRRAFLRRGLLGGAVLAGGGWVAWLRRSGPPGLGGVFAVLSPDEAGILLDVARRVVPATPGFPPPDAVHVPERVDAWLAMSHPGVQADVKRLLSAFDSALLGLLLDGAPVRFRSASPVRQDARLVAWSESRLDVRRTGFRALRRLICSAYYSSPATWGAVGYPGPPALGSASPVPASPWLPPRPGPAAPGAGVRARRGARG